MRAFILRKAAWAALALSGLGLAAWAGLKLASLTTPGVAEAEAAGEDLDRLLAMAGERGAARHQLADELIAGRLTLREAAARSRELDLQAGLGERFLCGVVLYAGEDAARFGDKLWAVPFQA